MNATTPGTTSLAYRRNDVEAILKMITAIVGPEDVPGDDIVDWFMSDLRPRAAKLLAEITPVPALILTLPSGRKRLLCPFCGHDGRGDDQHHYAEEVGRTNPIHGFTMEGALLVGDNASTDDDGAIEERVACGACNAEFEWPDVERDWANPGADYDAIVALEDDEEEPAPHGKDADCAGFILPDDTCAVCSVLHGEPCATCKGRGYHVEGTLPDCACGHEADDHCFENATGPTPLPGACHRLRLRRVRHGGRGMIAVATVCAGCAKAFDAGIYAEHRRQHHGEAATCPNCLRAEPCGRCHVLGGERMAMMDGGDGAWARAWSVIAARYGGVTCINPDTHDTWQYMGTYRGKHEFRHRALYAPGDPQHGKRARDHVEVRPGDFDVPPPVPVVTEDRRDDAMKYPGGMEQGADL